MTRLPEPRWCGRARAALTVLVTAVVFTGVVRDVLVVDHRPVHQDDRLLVTLIALSPMVAWLAIVTVRVCDRSPSSGQAVGLVVAFVVALVVEVGLFGVPAS